MVLMRQLVSAGSQPYKTRTAVQSLIPTPLLFHTIYYALIKEDVGIQLKEKKIERAKWTSAREQKAQEKQEKDLGTPSEAEHKN